MPESVPNYLTIDPATGAVGADFTGHIHAQGLDLDAGVTSTPPDQDRVRWLDTANGNNVADLYALNLTGGPSLTEAALTTYTQNAFRHAESHLRASDSAGGSSQAFADLIAQSRPEGPLGEILAACGALPPLTLFRSDGVSDLVQLVTKGRKVGIDFGVATCVWPGASTLSNTLTVNTAMTLAAGGASAYGLASRAPTCNFAIPAGITVSSFPLQGIRVDEGLPAAGTTASCFWILIGEIA